MNNLKLYFDDKYYLNKYPDIKKSLFKSNPINHFINYGYKELRHPCDLSQFDWDTYIYINNLNNNIKLAHKHFIQNGIINNYPITKKNTKLNNIIKNEFDIKFYKDYHTDLYELSNNELIKHFIIHGYYENRKFNNKEETQEIKKKTNEEIENEKEVIKYLNNIYQYSNNFSKYKFNIDIYKKFNNELILLSDIELYKHFIDKGYNEKRIFCNPIDDFDINFYLDNNSDIKLDKKDKNLAWNHYLYNGYFETKTYNKNHVITKYKTGIIYVYYNRPGEYKNETNLAFFINETIKKRDSKKDNLEFLFIINNYFTEVNIPNKDNIHVLKNKNCIDFEAYLHGITYFEKKYNKPIQNIYENIVFMNCSCTGPFTHNNNFWLKPFYDKMIQNDSVVCSPILTYLPSFATIKLSKAQIPGYMFIIKSKHINLLIKPNTICKNNNKFSNTVIGYKKDKYDCIISGEHSVSTIILQNNLNISGLCNIDLDYRKEYSYKQLQFSADRHPAHNYNLFKCIFIKNHWRIDNKSRDCHPVQWSITKAHIEKLSNFFYFSYLDLEYSLLNINDTGNIRYNNCKWNSKKEFVDVFSESEELILFPLSKMKKVINYIHTNDVIKRYTIEGIRALLSLDYKINFYTKLKEPFNFNIPASIIIINNLNYNKKLITLNSDMIFPCTDLNTFNNELESKKMKDSIKLLDNVKNEKDNKFINFLTFYL